MNAVYKPVDVDVYLIEAEKGLAGKVYVAVAMGRVPSEQKPKLTFYIVPPLELEKNVSKYKEIIKFVNADSEEFKSLRPELRRLAREALRSPSAYVPQELVEELKKK